MFGRVFGGATAYPKATGIWRDDERGGGRSSGTSRWSCIATPTPSDIQDADNLSELGRFCRRMGRETQQGEIGLVVGDEYFAIREYEE
jgi:hypothetical protein